MAAIAIEIPKCLNINETSRQSINFDQDRIKSKLIYEIQPNNLKIWKSNIPDVDVLNSLITKFLSDYSEKENLLEIGHKTHLVNGFITVAGRLFQLNPEKIGVEYSSNQNIYFFSKVKNFKIHCEVFFGKFDSGFKHCVINIFDGLEQVLNVSGDYSEVFNAMERIIPKSDPEIYKIISFKSE